MFVTKYIISLAAAAGLITAAYTVISGERNMPTSAPVARPAIPKFDNVVAGAGLIEASTQNVNVATDLSGIVTQVLVKVGDRVTTGQPLFELDDRQVRAELAVHEAKLAVAKQSLARLEALPRPEEIPSAQARVAELQAVVADARQQLARVKDIAPLAVNKEEVQHRGYKAAAAQAQLDEAKAALELLQAGSWGEDKALAQTQIKVAQMQLQAAYTELDRLIIKAPIVGEVLQVNIRPGEYVANGGTNGQGTPIVLGETKILHVRVDIDENDAWRVRPEARATASLRGNNAIKTELKFVRAEPLVVPKRSLTGASDERVDTRVLQVLYAFERGSMPVYVGQQMDVFIEAEPPDTTSLSVRSAL